MTASGTRFDALGGHLFCRHLLSALYFLVSYIVKLSQNTLIIFKRGYTALESEIKRKYKQKWYPETNKQTNYARNGTYFLGPFCKTCTRPLLCQVASLALHLPQECSTSFSEVIKYGIHPRQQQKQRIAAQPLNQTLARAQHYNTNRISSLNILCSTTRNRLNARHFALSANRTVHWTWC